MEKGNEGREDKKETYFLGHFRTFFRTKYRCQALRETISVGHTVSAVSSATGRSFFIGYYFSTLDVLDTW